MADGRWQRNTPFALHGKARQSASEIPKPERRLAALQPALSPACCCALLAIPPQHTAHERGKAGFPAGSARTSFAIFAVGDGLGFVGWLREEAGGQEKNKGLRETAGWVRVTFVLLFWDVVEVGGGFRC